MLHRYAFLAFLTLIDPSLGHAMSIPTLPAGMCTLDHHIPEHAVVMDYLAASNAGSNEVLSVFARCDELSAIKDKKAKSISHFGTILGQSVGEPIPLPRAEYVKAMASVFATRDDLVETALTGAREATASGVKGSGLNDPKAITANTKGVLYTDDTMLIIGMQQTNSYGNTVTNVSSTAAMTLLGGIPVSVNLYAPATDKNSFGASTETLKPFVAQLIAANP